MPTSKEVQPNRPLAGHELKQILLKDFESMLSGDGVFAAHMGYKRVAYEISIKLHVDNPLFPAHTNKRASKDPARNATEQQKAVEAPPLKNPGDDAQVLAMKREREIDSPNVARLENDLPVITTSVDRATGQVIEKQVRYDKHGITPSRYKDENVSSQTAHDWGVKE
jgi:hypothetical protein